MVVLMMDARWFSLPLLRGLDKARSEKQKANLCTERKSATGAIVREQWTVKKAKQPNNNIKSTQTHFQLGPSV